MGNDALKNLSLLYLRGELSKPEYRQQRREIIDGMTGNSDPEVIHSNKDPAAAQGQTHPLLKAGIISLLVVVGLLALYSAM